MNQLLYLANITGTLNLKSILQSTVFNLLCVSILRSFFGSLLNANFEIYVIEDVRVCVCDALAC